MLPDSRRFRAKDVGAAAAVMGAQGGAVLCTQCLREVSAVPRIPLTEPRKSSTIPEKAAAATENYARRRTPIATESGHP
jgi:hypothetical protein